VKCSKCSKHEIMVAFMLKILLHLLDVPQPFIVLLFLTKKCSRSVAKCSRKRGEYLFFPAPTLYFFENFPPSVANLSYYFRSATLST